MTTLDSRSGHRLSPSVPQLILTRDPHHGVTLYARRLAEALAEPHRETTTRHSAAAVSVGNMGVGERVHLHFTDRLWGTDPDAAAAAVEQLARRASVTVTLHDLPQPSDGARSLDRRAAAYGRVVRAASGVVCNSRHEADLLAQYVGGSAAPAIIPLPVDVSGPRAGWSAGPSAAGPSDRIDLARRSIEHARIGSTVIRDPDIGSAATAHRGFAHREFGLPRTTRSGPAPAVSVLGYVYPGKGHDRVLRAVGSLRVHPRPVVEALGRASEGHEHDLENVRRMARYASVALRISGFLPDDELLERCRRSAVPVIAHRHVSASGSLASWLAAGRRPLVLASGYMREMAALHRNALTVVDGRALGEAIEHAIAHPESTWLDDSAELGPDLAEVASLYRRFWNEVHG